LRALAEECFEDGYVLAIHAIGDRAIDLAAKSLRDFPKEANLFRIEHCEIVGPAQIEESPLGAGRSLASAEFCPQLGRRRGLYERRLGSERMRWSNRYRTLLTAGLPCIFGSDGMPAGPLYGLKGATENPLLEERLSPAEALACCTSRPHAVGAHIREAGTLEAGRFADFVLLDADPLTEDLDRIKVLALLSMARLSTTPTQAAEFPSAARPDTMESLPASGSERYSGLTIGSLGATMRVL